MTIAASPVDVRAKRFRIRLRRCACGVLFEMTAWNHRYHNDECRRRHVYGERVCEACGRTFVPADHTDGRFCSLACVADSRREAARV